MLIPHLTSRTVVGYARVSTERQDVENDALERQAEKIHTFCVEQEMVCTHIYKEVASAARLTQLGTRDGLIGAIRLCMKLGCSLVVTDLTRLDRTDKNIGGFLLRKGIQVISIRDGGLVTFDQAHAAAIRGKEGAANARAGTVRALGERRAAGIKLGSPGDNKTASIASAEVRSSKSRAVTDKIMAVMEEDETYLNLPLRGLADLLNSRGIRTSRGNAWTKASLKRQARDARARIAEMRREDPFISETGSISLEELEELLRD